jgi:Mn-dependent DtxR family transcriptional regulator
MRIARERSKPERGRPLSETTEDHLERINQLIEEKGYARVSDLAEVLQLSKSTVSNMLQRLAREGFLNYERYRGLTLTEEGRKVAQSVISRHRLLEEFFLSLGVSKQTAEHDIEGLEHHLSPETFEKMHLLLGHLRKHPLRVPKGKP